MIISRTALEECECGVKLFIKFLGGLMTTTTIKPVSAEIIPFLIRAMTSYHA